MVTSISRSLALLALVLCASCMPGGLGNPVPATAPARPSSLNGKLVAVLPFAPMEDCLPCADQARRSVSNALVRTFGARVLDNEVTDLESRRHVMREDDLSTLSVILDRLEADIVVWGFIEKHTPIKGDASATTALSLYVSQKGSEDTLLLSGTSSNEREDGGFEQTSEELAIELFESLDQH